MQTMRPTALGHVPFHCEACAQGFVINIEAEAGTIFRFTKARCLKCGHITEIETPWQTLVEGRELDINGDAPLGG